MEKIKRNEEFWMDRYKSKIKEVLHEMFTFGNN